MTSRSVPGSVTPEAELRTALIIPFPVRPMSKTPISEDRIARALQSLNAAMADQRKAVAAWRELLGELKVATAHLDESLQSYRANLAKLGTSVASLKAKARTLEEWAAGMNPAGE